MLRRLRMDPNNQRLRDALLITINGIAAGELGGAGGAAGAMRGAEGEEDWGWG